MKTPNPPRWLPSMVTSSPTSARRWLTLAALPALLLLSACSSVGEDPADAPTAAAEPAPLALSPIVPEPTGEHHPGRFVWHDLLTDNLDSAKKFYGGLFGWTFETRDFYTIIANQGVPIAGMAKVEFEPGLSSYWLPYLSVSDVDQTVATVKKAGATVLKGPGEMTHRGRYALISDPHGARVVLLRSTSGDPVPGPITVNGWLWNELWTDDVTDSMGFYRLIADYQSERVGDVGEHEYQVLSLDNKPTGGITSLPFEKVSSQWIPVIRVTDLGDIMSRVVELGGRTLIEPDHSLSEGNIALIQDPSGAILMVEPWTPPPATGGNAHPEMHK